MVYVLDTHTIAWFLEGSSRLGAEAKAAMVDLSADLVVPTIVLVEIEFLYAKKRASVSSQSVHQYLTGAANCVVYPLDEQVVSLIPTTLNIHDAIIVATGILYRDILSKQVSIIAKDREIAASGLVSTVW
jgi:PIN domain nuclease of toxin-antitoxin system